MKSKEAAKLRLEDIKEGDVRVFGYTVDERLYRSFVDLSGDRSPVHVDDAEARRRGFRERVMHGAILNAMLSHLIGMEYPGANALLQSVDMKYKKPIYLADHLDFEVAVDQKVEAVRVVVLSVKIKRRSCGSLVASAKVQVGVSE